MSAVRKSKLNIKQCIQMNNAVEKKNGLQYRFAEFSEWLTLGSTEGSKLFKALNIQTSIIGNNYCNSR